VGNPEHPAGEFRPGRIDRTGIVRKQEDAFIVRCANQRRTDSGKMLFPQHRTLKTGSESIHELFFHDERLAAVPAADAVCFPVVIVRIRHG